MFSNPQEKILYLKGQEIIRFIAKTLPQKPGVYQMEDENGKILYIGKAKNLAKRVINYTSLKNLTRRLQRMVSQTKIMNFFVTNTEVEALLLECNLIKRHNLDMENDFAAVVQKYFLYVLVGIALFAVIGAVVGLISSIL